jgi:serine protease Do
MKSLPTFAAALGLVALLPFAGAAESKSDSKPETKTEEKADKVEKKELRVLAAPDHGVRITTANPRTFFGTRTVGPVEKEPVTYLGIITAPVSATLSAQLGLPAGAGLVVNQLEDNSPAAAALKQHDILVKLDDQQLVDGHQLSVLIRQKKEGDEVTLTYIRAGKQATAKVKLGRHEVPKLSALLTEPLPGGASAFAWSQGGNDKFEIAVPEGREEVDHVLSLIEGHAGQPLRMWIDRSQGPGFRSMSVNTGNSNMVYSDDQGSLELTLKDEKKSLVAKNKKGEQVYAGPVNTPEERKALPDEVRARLEKLEGMQDVTFRTDNDFKGAETRMLRPAPRGISMPRTVPAPTPAPARPPLFF